METIQQLRWRMAPNMEETMDVQVVMETSIQAMTWSTPFKEGTKP